MRLLLLLLLSFSCSINCLKCRSQDGAGDAELKRIVRTCMQRSGSNGNQEDNDNRRYGNGNGRYNFDNDDYGQAQDRGQGQGRQQQQQQQQQSYGNSWQRSVKQTDNNNNNNNNNSNTSESGGCVALCFFEEMNMVDGSGQPDRRKVSYLLTKDLRDRELRNFYMDTVQQCFRYIEHSRYSNNNSNNKCSQARELVKCMSEYAKAQCDDWEEHGNMLFN
ncbi:odorant-binding protein 59a [Drosophila mojavensis]|uniref:Odorant-binding protein 59a n=1 Tax=Drosophila mojavensis TaxID=7230 RepID=B4KP99_DROMO|nr:odorant-binding protein 59a [Drosophila mojavensis]EDW09075.1 Odorant-binding protein 59a [Drosophila mojavensis]